MSDGIEIDKTVSARDARPTAQLDDYADLLGRRHIDRIYRKAADLSHLHVAHVSSTFYGGGVAELLDGLSLLMNHVGITTGWRVIQGAPDFFSITKKMHNALQGGSINLTDLKKQHYEDIVYKNALRNHLDHHNMVVVHDPQPLPLVQHYHRKGPWIWQCHVDLTAPNVELWAYLRSFIEQYDGVVVSLDEYQQPLETPQRTIPPAIDPFSIKNKELSTQEVNERLAHYDIPTDLPLVVQVSRFDRWKDPEGVIEAFKLATKEIDATLVLLGNVATDDPEGKEVYESLLDEQGERIYILSVEDTALVNALQRRAAVVLQKSLREGFGLTVTEAMWKGSAVIGGNVGGIRRQIEDGKTGFLVDSVEEAAERIVQLVRDPDLRERLGQAARTTVRDRFLLPHMLERYLDLFAGFETLYRLRD
ncbi:glycosyl transferase family 1 [Longibacter salinarum]|uniref:Glycosyl transferase family 1 n=1 Tax=Longibacter salinarum TaxID=1850348 RepID=A0A2A8D1Y2_9BACT|nr:glycosyltransferase [Longibacter salinarum]PEN14817.1 glycosyl transferase family 1 [Longibacter salinarum]